MRVVAAIVMLAGAGWAQFKSTVPLVVAPTTVTDSKGRDVDADTAAVSFLLLFNSATALIVVRDISSVLGYSHQIHRRQDFSQSMPFVHRADLDVS